MDATLERVWARWCARRVLHLWDAPDVVREWVDTGDEALRGEAAATRRRGFSSTARWAAVACVTAAIGVTPSWEARWAVGLAAGPAHQDGARARERESRAQHRAFALITTLSALLQEHGLAALSLDEAQEDRWLTREVWRALGLPDLQVVCDWAEVSR